MRKVQPHLMVLVVSLYLINIYNFLEMVVHSFSSWASVCVQV